MRKYKEVLNKSLQLIIVIILAIIMGQNFSLSNMIQGTGRTINYAGIVRGATQRMIKLEIAGYPGDDLIIYLDDVLNNLRYGGGKYQLDKLPDKEYQNKLEYLSQKWEGLKLDVLDYRIDHSTSKKEKVLRSSEEYFRLANEVVGTAEQYSENKVERLRFYEIILAIMVSLLIIISSRQTLIAVQLTKRNKELNIAAYIDKITGIPSRRSCEEIIWSTMDSKESPYCVTMFDLNNLKEVNDQLGHSAGDKLIKSFSDILIKFSNEKVFVGRYGGDEFLMIIHSYEEERIQRLLDDIRKQVEIHNNKGGKIQIKYASGYEYDGDSLHKMVDKADQKMYRNKKEMKESSKV